MIEWLKRLCRRLSLGVVEERIGSYPVVHEFPELGDHGQVTIDCIVRPSARPDVEYPEGSERLYRRGTGIPALRVGTLAVELDQHGLHLYWESGEPTDACLTSPFSRKLRAASPDQPDQERDHHDGGDPL